ncbi:MAG: ABC transporter permease, partial [Pseudomonas sp.]|nr:ABC transporter permease [Pseudomonas sp.]
MGTLNLRLSRWAERLPSLRPSLANLRGWAVPLALLLGLEALVRFGVLPSHQMPAPTQVAQTLFNLAVSGELLRHINAS